MTKVIQFPNKQKRSLEELVAELGTYVGKLTPSRALAIRKLNEELGKRRKAYEAFIQKYGQTMTLMLIEAGLDPHTAQELYSSEQVFVDVTGDVWIIPNDQIETFRKEI